MFEIIAKEAAHVLFGVLDERLKRQHPVGSFKVDLEQALTEADNWSKRVQFFGMSKGYATREHTIDLDYTSPRKFTNRDSKKVFSERDLITSHQNLILLGDPGSGKTTTLKRLVQLVIHAGERERELQRRFPIAIVLRESAPEDSIHEIICARLGLLKYCDVQKQREFDTNVDRLTITYLGRTPLRDALPKILDQLVPIIFIDGLDEIDQTQRSNIEVEVSRLARRLKKAKVIISCRSGDFVRNVEGFDVLEIRPLTQNQIKAIAKKWLNEPDGFFKEISKFPNQDFLDRPLLLAQLIVIFSRAGYLPDQPSAVYKRILFLLLRDWDEERQIVRKSAYANFEREQKYEFLCSIAYHLTCIIKVRHFTHEQLVQAYLSAHSRFNLPAGQSREVAREIETHTGIIVELGDNNFEFSHLTLQEYLCAEYLVREPFADLRRRYLEQYPGPLAVAVTLSANPSRWLAHLIAEIGDRSSNISWSSFLDRIATERPRFIR